VSGEILAKLAALDLLAKGFVLLFLAGLIFGAHYAYPLVHGAAPLICK